jgi:hypothetical protein
MGDQESSSLFYLLPARRSVSHYVSESLEKMREAETALKASFINPKIRAGLVNPRERIQWLTDLHALRLASPFYWNNRTTDFVKGVMGDFDLESIRATRSLLYDDVAWHWFADAPPFHIEEYKSRRLLPVRAITWYWFGHKGKPYVGATAWTQMLVDNATDLFCGPVYPVLWTCVEEHELMSVQIEGARLDFKGYVDDRTVEESRWLRQFVVTASTFLRQELLTAPHVPVERHAKKRLLRTDAKAKLPDIAVVQLRRAARSAAAAEAERGEEHREWKWQWTVRGHVRMQLYKTLGEHLPVYIHPYLKGPEDKPIKPRTTPIYSVTR